MECADRIAVMTEDRALEPVRLLRDNAALMAVSVRVVAAKRRCDVTIRRAGAAPAQPLFSWDVREVDADGTTVPAGLELDGASEAERLTDPEEAYWAAVESIAGANG